MRLFTAIAFSLFLGAYSLPAAAFSCGFAPTDAPVVPDGTKAEREDITAAIEAVQAYATRVNAHLNCLDEERSRLFMNMNKEQQERWTDDYNALIDHLTEIETGLNEQIRIYNERLRASDQNSGQSSES